MCRKTRGPNESNTARLNMILIATAITALEPCLQQRLAANKTDQATTSAASSAEPFPPSPQPVDPRRVHHLGRRHRRHPALHGSI